MIYLCKVCQEELIKHPNSDYLWCPNCNRYYDYDLAVQQGKFIQLDFY